MRFIFATKITHLFENGAILCGRFRPAVSGGGGGLRFFT
jgi:hypothetical protein